MTTRTVEYAGMSYEQASREAERLINQVGWYRSFDRLAELRGIMLRHRSFTSAESPKQ